jgi:D-glycero-D-manno-heptose 1,7-bisphosphate phosphatase
MTLIPGAGRAIVNLHEAGYAVVVITSQSCVGMGYVTKDTVSAVHDRMNQLLAVEGGSDLALPDGIFYSTGAGNSACAPSLINCDNAKPAITLLQEAVDQFQLEWHGSWMVGDRDSDLQTARNANIPFVLVRTGDGLITESRCRADGVEPKALVADLESAAAEILKHR